MRDEMAETVTVTKEKETSKPRATPPAPAKQPEMIWPSLTSLRTEFDRLFDQLGRSFTQFPMWRRSPEVTPLWRFEAALGMNAPAVELTEKDQAFEITAELPGMEASEVDVSVSGGILTIKGEKKEEKETKEKNYYFSERRYGSFQRSFELPEGVDGEKISAKLENGLLTITLPKTKEAVQRQRKIPVSSK
jgi:HSP20 family protein